MLKRLLKGALYFVGAVIALCLLAVLSVFLLYYSTVRPKPGALSLEFSAGALGEKVNVFAGTGGIFYVCPYDTPAAMMPFGMVRLGPDTASLLLNKTGLNAAGYYYSDNKIIGFSHNRLVGADAREGGNFRIFPTVAGRVKKMRDKERFSRFSHGEETAFPGYYAVRLPKDDILVELTATPRVGIHRYTFRPNDVPHLLLDVTSVLGDRRCKDGLVQILPEAREIEGSTRMYGSFSGRYDGLDVYFAARFSEPFAEYGVWSGDSFTAGASSTAGDDIGVDLGFEKTSLEKVVEVRLALSYVSIKNARENLNAEAPAGKNFSMLTADAQEAWEKTLGRIKVHGGAETQQRIFYTALYHAFNMPTLFTDVNGEYRGFDREVHAAEDFKYYTDFSLWDTFRNVHSLFNIVARDEQGDMMRSLVEMAKAGGAFPRWPAGCGYTNCMFGTPADIAVTEAYLKGIRDFDIQAAYESMRRVALEGPPPNCRFGGRNGLEWYLSLGYGPDDKMNKSVSATLEYAYADYALSLLAKELGHEEDAKTFAEHARFYRNLWNPDTQFFQARDVQGNFSEFFKPTLLSYVDFDGKFTKCYVEGSAMQWRWAVPFDPEGLISLFKSREYFISELDAFFANCTAKMGAWNPGGYYWQGNEPDLFSAYLFNSAGRPDLTQKWVRWILDTRYADNYVGLDGNDDAGTLSAWYVFSALGFYPLAGSTKYELGTPLFDAAEIHLGDKVLSVIAENSGPENIYVKRVWINDKPLDRPWFTHDEIANGGTLRFEMSPTP